MDLSKILDAIKLSPKYLVPVSLVAGFLLFSPDKSIEKLGLLQFKDDYVSWIGVTFLISLSLVGTHFGVALFNWGAGKSFSLKTRFKQWKKLRSLNQVEKEILRYYFINNTTTQTLDSEDLFVYDLVTSRVIDHQFSILNSIYSINPWVLNYLRKHQNLMD